ncbi:MAG: DUF6768 family protein [Kangiellaceae bacterium]|jgi:hypothetical protein
MNIDEKIKQDLLNDSPNYEEIAQDKEGLFDLVFGSFRGGMGRWVIAVNVFTLLATGIMIWTGYEFFISEVVRDQIFWGVCLLLAVFAQVALKQWLFMEMNRSSLMREIKRVEIAVAHLAAKSK